MTSRTISATEAKNRLGAYLKLATEDGEVVIVEKRNEPSAVIISFPEYQRLKKSLLALEQQEQIERFRRVMARQAERNSDLTDEEAEELAIRAVLETRAARRAQTSGA